VNIVSPPGGYTAPVTLATVFLTNENPKIANFDVYDNLTEDKYNSLSENLSVRERQEKGQPILYSRCKPVILSAPFPSGKYILLKLIASGLEQNGMDVKLFQATGFVFNTRTCDFVDFSK